MRLSLLLLVVLLGSITAHGYTENITSNASTGDQEDNIAGIVAHAIHSIECQLHDKWKLNGIPLLSQDLAATDDTIISTEPKCLWTNKYSDWRFNYLDYVMKNLDDKNTDMGEYTKTERLLHYVHMVNVWERIDERIHHQWCVKCIFEAKLNTNKIKAMLTMIHHKVKDQKDLQSKHKVQSDRSYWSGNIYKFNFRGNQDEGERDTFPHITDYPSWVPWGDAMASVTDDEIELVARELYTFSLLITFEQVILYILIFFLAIFPFTIKYLYYIHTSKRAQVGLKLDQA